MVLMDNARVHKSQMSMSVIDFIRMPTIFTGPGSMTCSPVERTFGTIKLQDIDIDSKTNKM